MYNTKYINIIRNNTINQLSIFSIGSTYMLNIVNTCWLLPNVNITITINLQFVILSSYYSSIILIDDYYHCS